MANTLQIPSSSLLVGLICVSMISSLPVESDGDINFWRTENEHGKMESFHLKAKWDSHYLVVTPKNGMLISKDVSSSGDSGDSYKYGSLFRLCGKLTNLCPENSNCSHQAEICVVEGEREVESKIVYDAVHNITVRKDEFLHTDETLNILWSPIHAVWEGDVTGLGSKRSECIVLQESGKSSHETENIRLRSQEMENLDYYPLNWYDESYLKKKELVHLFKVCKPNGSC